MSNIQKINDMTILSDEQFYDTYGQSKTDFISHFEEESNGNDDPGDTRSKM